MGCISNCRFFYLHDVFLRNNVYLCGNQTNKELYVMSREEFLSIADSYYAEFESLKDSSGFYDYEKSLAETMQKIGCEYMEKDLNEGSVTKDRRKKKR
jgi:hypothetical protein